MQTCASRIQELLIEMYTTLNGRWRNPSSSSSRCIDQTISIAEGEEYLVLVCRSISSDEERNRLYILVWHLVAMVNE